jgi:hypothetical protein
MLLNGFCPLSLSGRTQIVTNQAIFMSSMGLSSEYDKASA